jgi:hypothetical protein
VGFGAVFNGSFGWLSLKPWLFFFFAYRIGVFCVMLSIVIIVISPVAVIVSVGFAGVAWVSSVSLVLVFVLIVFSVVKFVRDTWIRGRVDLRDFIVVADLEIMLTAFFLLFLSLK